MFPKQIRKQGSKNIYTPAVSAAAHVYVNKRKSSQLFTQTHMCSWLICTNIYETLQAILQGSTNYYLKTPFQVTYRECYKTQFCLTVQILTYHIFIQNQAMLPILKAVPSTFFLLNWVNDNRNCWLRSPPFNYGGNTTQTRVLFLTAHQPKIVHQILNNFLGMCKWPFNC